MQKKIIMTAEIIQSYQTRKPEQKLKHETHLYRTHTLWYIQYAQKRIYPQNQKMNCLFSDKTSMKHLKLTMFMTSNQECQYRPIISRTILFCHILNS